MADETEYSPRDAQPGDQGKKSGSLLAFPRTRGHPPDNNLPLELTSFIGREREVAEVKKLLDDWRLLTLCGPGGCGKTRLALAVARDAAEGFEAGVYWVELASLSDSRLVGGALASALGVREAPDRPLTEVLVEHLAPRKTLLVLDNCEHLVEGCAALTDTVLRACPELKILATSREPLRVAGEVTWLVPSLSLPDPQDLLPTGELARYEAVRLFVERAKATGAGFTLSERNASAVGRLCRKLDGLPLAIELAAARARALTVEQIAEKLEDPLKLLTTDSRTVAPRHQTLRATLRWSYELLGKAERTLFRRLSIFSGGWDLEAAEAVGAGEPVQERVSNLPVLDLLSTLVDKSLVVVEASGEEGASILRYGMLELVRQYGREKLEESPEAPEVRRRHAEHYLAFAEEAEPELLGADQGEWLWRLRTEIGNLRDALSWSMEPGEEEERAELRLRLVAALWRFWDVQGLEEGRGRLEAALERDAGEYPAVRAKALSGLGWILLFQRNYEPAIAILEEAVSLYKELGDLSGTGFALGNLGYAVVHGRYLERIPAFVEEAETLMRGDLDHHSRALLGITMALATLEEGNVELAVARLRETLVQCREQGNLRDTAMSLFILSMIELVRENLDHGAVLLEESARITRELGDRLGGAYCVWAQGKVAFMRGDPVRAAKLWGAAEALREKMGMSFSPFDLAQSGYERDLASARSSVDERTWTAAWSEGRAMSPQQAIEYALDASHEEDAHPPAFGAVLRIFTLGPARVEKGGYPLASPDWVHKPRELLYYLLSHSPRTKEQIGLDLWPDASTARLRSSFHDTVYRLRRALGGKEWIFFENGRYAFDRSLDYFFDVEAFEENLSEARRIQSVAPEQAIRHLERAADLYGGDFLEESVDGEWAMARQEELKREYGEALLLLGRLLSGQGRHTEAAKIYRKAIAHDELLEEAHRDLMRCYAAKGERGRALRHYEALVELLDERLDAPPAAETSALYERLRGDRFARGPLRDPRSEE